MAGGINARDPGPAMLSVLDGSLSERLSVRMPDVRRLAMRDWPAFVRVGEEIVSGERAMASTWRQR